MNIINSSNVIIDLIAQYEAYYEAFQQDPNQAHAQALLQFVQAHESQLESIGNAVDYQPYQGATMQDCLNSLETSLEDFEKGAHNADAVDEFGGNVGYMMGVGNTPEEIEQCILTIIEGFEKKPSVYLAKNLLWILSAPGFVKVLEDFSSNPSQMATDIDHAISALRTYINSPSDPKQLDAALQAILNDIR